MRNILGRRYDMVVVLVSEIVRKIVTSIHPRARKSSREWRTYRCEAQGVDGQGMARVGEGFHKENVAARTFITHSNDLILGSL